MVGYRARRRLGFGIYQRPWILLGANREFVYLMNDGFFDDVEDDVEDDVDGPVFATVGPTWLVDRLAG
jgi:hypothetical protein